MDRLIYVDKNEDEGTVPHRQQSSEAATRRSEGRQNANLIRVRCSGRERSVLHTSLRTPYIHDILVDLLLYIHDTVLGIEYRDRCMQARRIHREV